MDLHRSSEQLYEFQLNISHSMMQRRVAELIGFVEGGDLLGIQQNVHDLVLMGCDGVDEGWEILFEYDHMLISFLMTIDRIN
jgi:hypothetical protein